jgi:hypothetical protein
MQMGSSIGASGELALRVIGNGHPHVRTPVVWPGRAVHAVDVLEHGTPQRNGDSVVNRWRHANRRHLRRGLLRLAAARTLRLPHFTGQLWLDVIHGDGEVDHLGLASLRVVTTAGVNSIVDAFGNTFELENYDFHGFGTGTNAEAVGDTALQTEETTQYAPDNTRPTGSPSEPSANVYRSVATYSPDSGGTRAITEHGLFSQAATGGGTLLDRSVFSAVNLVAGSDSLQATYDFTVNSGG